MAELESTAEQTREQLAALLSQQDELKSLLARLLEGLEAAGLSTPAEASSSFKALSKTVRTKGHDWFLQLVQQQRWVSLHRAV